MREVIIKSCLNMMPKSLQHWMVGDFIPVFMMHRIIDDRGDLDHGLVKQLTLYLEYIRKHQYKPVTLDDLIKCLTNNEKIPQRSLAFSVDDGFADQFEHLGPIFSSYDIPLTCFVITDFLDGKLWPWDDQIKHIITNTEKQNFSIYLPGGEEFIVNLGQGNHSKVIESLRSQLKSRDQTNLYDWLPDLYRKAEVIRPDQPPERYRAGSWYQANEFVRSGHAIAAHTKTHRILSRLNDSEAELEIIGSYQELKTKVPDCSDSFAFPTGRPADFGTRERQIIARSEISGAVSTVPDAVRPGYAIEALPRFALPNRMSDFLQCLSFVEVLKNRIRRINPT